ncbi:MAG: type IV secretion system DNA-binding domain-containing protein, partial [Phycisphaerae bacterium]
MSIEHALIAQPRAEVLAVSQRQLYEAELEKGRLPQLANQPVAMEPPFTRIGLRVPDSSVTDRNMAETSAVIPDHELVRLRIWISPEQSCKWHLLEGFLKQTRRAMHRISFELAGNREGIELSLTCHKLDLPIVSIAFRSQLEYCKLTVQRNPILRSVPVAAWDSVAFEDLWPPSQYSHLLTRLDELRYSPLSSVITAMADLRPPALGLYQVLFQPVAPTHDWHSNVEALVNLEFRLKALAGSLPLQRYPMQEPGNELRGMAMDTEMKAHPDKPFFVAALRVAIARGGTRAPIALRALSTFSSLIQHGGYSWSILTQEAYKNCVSPNRFAEMFLQGHVYHPGFLLNSWELCSLVHLPPADQIERRNAPIKLLEPLQPESSLNKGTFIGLRSDVGRDRAVCLSNRMRMEHTHMIGATGTGKSTVMLHMILNDIRRGDGVALLDPHGQLVEDLLPRIPAAHHERIIYINLGDKDWVPLWNPVRSVAGQD